MLRFDSVEFAYPKTEVLKGLSLTVGPGEVVGFLGVNGAGKTTTFLLATGIYKPSAGHILLFGQAPSSGKAWTKKTGVLFSGGGLYPRLSVRRHLKFFAELRGLSGDLDQHLLDHGLKEFADKPAGQLSHGYKRKLALACATVHSPDLLLLDEPSDGLDPGSTEDLYELLKVHREAGKSVLLTSHRLEEVERICDRVALLSGGLVVKEGTPQALREEEEGKNLREIVLALRARGDDPRRRGVESAKATVPGDFNS